MNRGFCIQCGSGWHHTLDCPDITKGEAMNSDKEFCILKSKYREMLELVEPRPKLDARELVTLSQKYYNALNCIGLDNQCKVSFQELRRC